MPDQDPSADGYQMDMSGETLETRLAAAGTALQPSSINTLAKLNALIGDATLGVWRTGTGAPADALGADGDYYLDSDADAWYGPKAGGTWTGTGPHSLQGPQGDIGPQGPQGIQGETGPTGPAGADGLDGAPGADGADGRTWHSGAGAPADGTGADGDYYLDTAASAPNAIKQRRHHPNGWQCTHPHAALGRHYKRHTVWHLRRRHDSALVFSHHQSASDGH